MLHMSDKTEAFVGRGLVIVRQYFMANRKLGPELLPKRSTR